MGLFSFTQEIAIDLGTANTIIMCDDKIVIDEPSVVAISMADNKMVAVGRKAQQMIGKGGSMIRTVRPLRDGVIADFYACEMMIRGMIKMIPKQARLFSPSIRMVVCIPSGSTEVEIRAVRDSSEHAGGRDVYMIYEPMAAAIGIGIDVESPEGCMIVDIGGGTTEIAVISLGGIVSNKSIKIAGDDFNQDIIEYMGRMHNLRIDEPTAERIKIQVGSFGSAGAGGRAGRFHRRWSEQSDGSADVRSGKLSGDLPLSGEEYLEDRGRYPAGFGVHSSGVVLGYRETRYLPDRWWCVAAWSGTPSDG